MYSANVSCAYSTRAGNPLPRLLFVYNCNHRTTNYELLPTHTMSNNQTAINQTTDAYPWKDWKVDLGFFIEIDKYLGGKKKSFLNITKQLIDKSNAGGDLGELKDIIVSDYVSFMAALYKLNNSRSRTRLCQLPTWSRV